MDRAGAGLSSGAAGGELELRMPFWMVYDRGRYVTSEEALWKGREVWFGCRKLGLYAVVVCLDVGLVASVWCG